VRLIARRQGRETDIEVVVRRPAATAAELRAALARAGLDDEPSLGAGPLADLGLRRGAALGATPVEVPGTGTVLAVVGGTCAGELVPLPVGRLTIGRERTNDLVLDHETVSGRHAVVTRQVDGRITIEDLGSRNGSWVGDDAVLEPRTIRPDEVVRLGATLLAVLELPADDAPAHGRPPSPDGTVAVHRPPRPAPPGPPAPLALPAADQRAPARTPFSLTAVLAPILLAGVLVLVLGSFRYAVFALLSPVMAIGSWWESNRRSRRQGRQGSASRKEELRDLAARVEQARHEEVRRRHAIAPWPAEARRRAGRPSVRLWERRPGHADHGVVHLGTATIPWAAPADGVPADDVADVLAGPPLVDVPVPLDLGPGQVLGIAGDATVAAAVARSVVLQLATHTGPADLRIEGPWPELAWLPHHHLDAPTTLVVVDDVTEVRGSCGARLTGPGTAAVVLAPTASALPAVCTTVLELDGADGTARLTRPGVPGDGPVDLLVAGLTEGTARAWARALAPWVDGDAPDGIGSTASFDDVAPHLGPGVVPLGMDGAGVVPAGERTVVVSADEERRRATLVAAALAAATTHRPDQLRLVLLEHHAGGLAPLHRLPHVVATDLGGGARRLGGAPTLVVAEDAADLPDRLDARALAGSAAGDGVDLDRPGFRPVDLRGPASADEAVVVHALDEPLPTELDRALERALALAGHHRPAPLDDGGAGGTPSLGLAGLLGLSTIDDLDPARSWHHEPGVALRAAIGVDGHGTTLHLDLKETAQGGIGPHGLVVGATGSGKSELLRTLVAGLAATHSPDELAFVLVDFKGGATFAPLAGLPHVAGMVTNLQDDAAVVDRVRTALGAEQRRRQELLRDAGNLSSVAEHAARRREGAELEPLPTLLVIVDEFAELLAQEPDFVDVFVSIGRLGRSLGMHLLLASQRLDEGKLRGLESHLSYRVCLRTFTTAESRAVLGVPDAGNLPPIPGTALLRTDGDELVRFRAGMVAGDMAPLVERLAPAAPPAHQVWLAPLPPRIGLDAVTGPLTEVPERGLTATGWPGVGRLAVPLGVVDVPEWQAQRALAVDLAGTEANLAVIGGAQSGKSTLLRTLILGAAGTHAPTELAFHAIDYGGGSLERLVGLPHVGTVAGRLDPERARRVVDEVVALLDHRQRLFAEHAVGDVTTFRDRRRAGELPEPFGDVVLVIDGWAAFRAAHEDLEPVLADLAARGPGFGVHLVLSANRWLDLRPAIRDPLGGRLELRLSDPGESAVDRRTAATVPAGVPGRLLTADGHHAQVALADEAVVPTLAAAWTGPVLPPVRVLPSKVLLDEVPASENGVPLGVGGRDLGAVGLDLGGADPHLLVLGDGESGKSTLLRTFLLGLVERTTPREARVLVVDYRRSLLDVVPADRLLAYAGSAPAAADAVQELRTELVKRLPGADVTAAQLRDRSWWSGPDVYVVVDDYDLVAVPTGNPLAPLLDLLAQGRDIGLHLLVARRVSGASRAFFEPVLQRLKELGTPGVILSGDRQEGALLGAHRASEQPPGRALLVRAKGEPTLLQVATS
jgi:S-DNA-T family DNA segregation ATPase FtsK/SpoIIIE